MILPRKRLLVDIFFTRRLSKSLAVCEFASVNFEPWTCSHLVEVGYCHIIMSYIGMCRCEGYGFQAVYSGIGYINERVWV